jgi:thymidylate synthase (FAD)
VKILRRPDLELFIRPDIDWKAFAAFLERNFGVQEPMGLALDEVSKAHAQKHPGDAIPMACAKSCYKAWATGRKNIWDYLGHIKESGHGSVLEHSYFGFITMTTRCIANEIVRHRAGWAYSQESQRFCDEKDNSFIMPLSVQGDEIAELIWTEHMGTSLTNYVRLTDRLMGRFMNDPDFKDLSKTDMRKKVREASRGVLPNDTSTVLHCTANVRSWRHFIEMRSSRHAEAGIRLYADRIWELLVAECPILFGDYERVLLKDGTFELTTKHTKV